MRYYAHPGHWTLGFDGGYVFRYLLDEPAGTTDLVNTVGYPLRFRFPDFVSLQWGPLESSLF
jgi:hypothetical protein